MSASWAGIFHADDVNGVQIYGNSFKLSQHFCERVWFSSEVDFLPSWRCGSRIGGSRPDPGKFSPYWNQDRAPATAAAAHAGDSETAAATSGTTANKPTATRGAHAERAWSPRRCVDSFASSVWECFEWRPWENSNPGLYHSMIIYKTSISTNSDYCTSSTRIFG